MVMLMPQSMKRFPAAYDYCLSLIVLVDSASLSFFLLLTLRGGEKKKGEMKEHK